MNGRIVFAAPKSGSGKTMITCGLISLFLKHKIKVSAFKCGPDYIDPMFHRQVLGVPAGNLDSFFTGEDVTRQIFAAESEHGDLSVIEGVMGYYDGLGGVSEKGSTYDLARMLDAPVILIVNAKGASVSLAALIRGFLDYRKDSHIAGVFLNRISDSFYGRIKEVIETECQVPVVGYLPELKNMQVPSRHLGLYAPEELADFQSMLLQLREELEKRTDLNAILEIAEKDCSLDSISLPPVYQAKKTVKIGVARDEAFSFYYRENLELLERMGAEVVFFSPLQDAHLPFGLSGLLLGGGYPERYGKELAENQSLREEIKKVIENGMPYLAECGGFLYLQDSLTAEDGETYPMVGVYRGTAKNAGKLTRFGYVELTPKHKGLFFGLKNPVIRGHEFHHWDCTENGEDFTAKKPVSDLTYDCMFQTENSAAGFPHLYYYSNPEYAERFVRCCERFSERMSIRVDKFMQEE